MTFWGLMNRSDDNGNQIYDSTLTSFALETAEARLLVYVGQDYVPTDLIGNVWITWATALIASIFFCRRGGDLTPAGLQEEYEELLYNLDRIQKGQIKIPGIVQPGDYGGISYTNYELDWRLRLPITRPVLSHSTGSPTSTLPRRSLYVFTNDDSYWL